VSILRKLAGQTAIYGVSSIVARFLNYLLLPLFTSVFLPNEYGVITALYAWTAFLNVVLTYGMETTYFRYANKNPHPQLLSHGEGLSETARVYSTATYALSISSILFMVLAGSFSPGIAAFLGYPGLGHLVFMLVLVIGVDALTVVPMARLRQQDRPWKFAMINFITVGVNVVLNLFILLYCLPKYNAGQNNALIDAVFDPRLGVGYVFLINAISSGVKLLLLLPQWPPIKLGIDTKLLRPMFLFATPLAIAGLAGMVNETADRALMKHLLPAGIADTQLGIYGACYKLAMLITLFSQAFRYAAEPFFFSHAKEKDSAKTFARIMNVFVAVCMGAFLLVMLFIDVFKELLIRNPAYWPGLAVVPILMIANVCLGIYYNQSVWYKLTDKTRAGGTIAVIGATITLTLLVWWIPIWGYMGAAWATLVCYASMTVISYIWGHRHYPIPYNVSRVLTYMAFGVVGWWGCEQLPLEGVAKYALRAAVLALYLALVWKKEWAKATVR
jgi:O-antigen/teichoic acid export membrane protein